MKLKWRYLSDQDYEECVNDVNYALSKRDTSDIKNFEVFKRICIRNALVNRQIKNKKGLNNILNFWHLSKTDSTTYYNQETSDDNSNLIKDMIYIIENRLPNTQRKLIKMLLKNENVTLASIARKLRKNENTIKANYRHALLTLRKEMGVLKK